MLSSLVVAMSMSVTSGPGQVLSAFRWLFGLGEEELMVMLPHKKDLSSTEFWEDHYSNCS